MFIPLKPNNPFSWLVYIILAILTFGLYMVAVIVIEAVTSTDWFSKMQTKWQCRQRRR